MDHKNKVLFVKYVTNRVVNESRDKLNKFLDTIHDENNRRYVFLSIRIDATKSRYFSVRLRRSTGTKNDALSSEVFYSGYNLFGEKVIKCKSADVDMPTLEGLIGDSIFMAVNTILKLNIETRSDRGSNVYYIGLSTQSKRKIKGIYPNGQEKVIKLFLTYLSKGKIYSVLYDWR